MGGVINPSPDGLAAWRIAGRVALCALAMGLLACGESEPLSAPSASVNEDMPGAWTSIDAWHEEAQEAARFAVQTYAVGQRSRVLYKDVLAAEQQVVAGLNFKLRLQVQHDKTVRRAQVTVWRQLSGQYQLTEWVWLD